MDRESVVKELIMQLKRLPDRKMCATVVTEKQLRIIAQQMLDFRNVTDYIEDGSDLNLEESEIPNDLWFQLVLFISLERTQEIPYGILNEEIFAEPQKVLEKLKTSFYEIGSVLEESKDSEIAYIDLGKVLAVLKH